MTITRAFALALLLAGCSKGDPGPAGERGEQGIQGPPGMMGTAGKDGIQTKVPHLMAGNLDLGPLTAPDTTFDEKMGVEINWTQRLTAYWSETKCVGEAVTSSAPAGHQTLRNIDSLTGTLIQVLPTKKTLKLVQSQQQVDGQGTAVCFDIQLPDIEGREYLDLKIPARLYSPSELSVEMR